MNFISNKFADPTKVRTKWKEEEDTHLRELWDEKYSILAIAKRIGRSYTAIHMRASHLGLEKKKLHTKRNIKL